MGLTASTLPKLNREEKESPNQSDFEVFHVDESQDEEHEEIEFGNDYFTRNGVTIPVNDTATDTCYVELDDTQDEDDDITIVSENISVIGEEEAHHQEAVGIKVKRVRKEVSKPGLKDYKWCLMSTKKEFKFLKEFSFSKDCEKCGATFTTKPSFMLHDTCYTDRLAIKKGTKRRQRNHFECLECDKSWSKMVLLSKHSYSHYEPRYECKLCPYITCHHHKAVQHEGVHMKEYQKISSLTNRCKNKSKMKS